MEILEKIADKREMWHLIAEWKRNRERVEKIPEIKDDVLDMLLERAGDVAYNETKEEILKAAKDLVEAEEEEKVDSAIVELIVQAERKKMAIDVIKHVKAEISKREE